MKNGKVFDIEFFIYISHLILKINRNTISHITINSQKMAIDEVAHEMQTKTMQVQHTQA